MTHFVRSSKKIGRKDVLIRRPSTPADIVVLEVSHFLSKKYYCKFFSAGPLTVSLREKHHWSCHPCNLCKICGKVVNRMSRHLPSRERQSANQFNCKMCGKKLMTKATLIVIIFIIKKNRAFLIFHIFQRHQMISCPFRETDRNLSSSCPICGKKL